jgi:hypothetical protein
VAIHRIRVEGPAELTLRIVTALADADGIELVSSEPPSRLGPDMVGLDVAVEGELEAVTRAVDGLQAGLPASTSIALAGD